jgi:cyclic pyranopterin phosphate synthase
MKNKNKNKGNDFMVKKVEVFISPTSPVSAMAVKTMAEISNDLKNEINVSIINILEDSEKVFQYNITDLPSIVIDGKLEFIGVPDKKQLLNKLKSNSNINNILNNNSNSNNTYSNNNYSNNNYSNNKEDKNNNVNKHNNKDNKKLTHLTENGVHMVEVGEKPTQKRIAIAKGTIKLQKETIAKIKNNKIEKGNVLTTAQIAAITSIKNTSNIIPLCHPLQITGITVDFDIKNDEINVETKVKTLGQTGVEMEAITGVSVALLTIWDMVKSIEKDNEGQYPNTAITNIHVIKKEKI